MYSGISTAMISSSRPVWSPDVKEPLVVLASRRNDDDLVRVGIASVTRVMPIFLRRADWVSFTFLVMIMPDNNRSMPWAQGQRVGRRASRDHARLVAG